MSPKKYRLLDRDILKLMGAYLVLFFGCLLAAACGWQIFKLMVRAAAS